MVLKRIIIYGSIVGTRRNLAGAIAFAMEGKVRTTVKTRPLDEVIGVLAALKQGTIEGRTVLTI